MKVTKTSDSKEHLCNSCEYGCISKCPKAEVIEFGDGLGNDNVIACSEFKKLEG